MSRSRGRGGKAARGKPGKAQPAGGAPAGTLPRAQIDVLLERIGDEARQCLRTNPDDPAVLERVVERTRELLRVTEIEHHLYIGDSAHQLITSLGGNSGQDEEDDQDTGADSGIIVSNADLMHSVQLRGAPVADAGLQFVDDPFDIDAYTDDSDDAAGQEAAAVEAEPAEAAPETPAVARERRKQSTDAAMVEMQRGLTSQQLNTLETMSHFGWTLRFVRRPMFEAPIPVAFDRNTNRFVVIEADGSVDEDPGLQIRD